MTSRRNVVYCRLSRDDLREPGTTEDKLRGQESACRRLAEQYGLTVHEVLVERASGGTLAGRPELLKLLHLCRRGEVGVIFCTFSDRLSRLDGRDRYDFEEALTEGNVTVITTQGETRYHADEEPFGRRVLAEAAAYELRAYGRRRKERNRQKITENKRLAGSTPYGYRKDPSVPCGYRTVPHEFAIARRIFAEVLSGRSLNGIATRLNAEGIPCPKHRQSGRGTVWHVQTIRKMVLNSFYAGRVARRSTTTGAGSTKRIVQRRPDEYEIAPEPGEWPAVVDYADWLRICAQFASRRREPQPAGMLTRILHCPDGGSMVRDGHLRYACRCDLHGGKSVSVARTRAEDLALRILRAVFDLLPTDALNSPDHRPPEAELLRAYGAAQKALREAREAADELMRRAAFFASLMGEQAYQESVRRAGVTLRSAEEEANRLQRMIEEPRREDLRPMVERIRTAGFMALWDELSTESRREIIELVMERIDLAPKRSAFSYQRVGSIVLRNWLSGMGVTEERVRERMEKPSRRRGLS